MSEFLVFMRNLCRMLHFVRGVLVALIVMLLIAATVLAHADGLSFFDALYLTFITALTVGFGDIAPASGIARIVSVLTGVIGVILMGLIVAVSTRALELAVAEERKRRGEG